jgi:NAD(P)H-hydrate epimerase
LSDDPLYTAAQTRELDRIAIEDCGIPGIRLMSRAGRASFDLLLAQWPEPEHVHVFCGSGNNGGDGFIVAALARVRGIPVTVYQLGDPDSIVGDAATARNQAVADGVEVQAFSAAVAPASGLVVDALLGTGLSGDVRGAYSTAIDTINNSGLPVLAIDIPSGLCSDTGRVLGTAVSADHTITFIGMKQGLLTAAAPACTGDLHFAGLEVPDTVYAQVAVDCRRLDLATCLRFLPALPRHAHKGLLGHALVVGGDIGMGGAAVMAAEAAARCGAGLVSAATRAEHVAALLARRPEIMVRGVTGGNDLQAMLDRPGAIAIGPGLGSSPWSEQMLQRVTDTGVPLVVDADALNMLAAGRVVEKPQRDNWILTPHPGEAARLLECSSADIQADRFAAVRKLQQRYGGVAILKGAGTLICAGDIVYLSSYGNPGMASGGMGDVLSGVLVSLLAQGLEPLPAACLGVCLHGAAADRAANVDGMRGLLATDLLPHLRRLLDA